MLTAKHLTYAKAAIQFVTAAGVTKIVHDIIDNNTVSESTFDIVKSWAGGMVIASMVADQASDHVASKIDNFAAWCEKTKATADAK